MYTMRTHLPNAFSRVLFLVYKYSRIINTRLCPLISDIWWIRRGSDARPRRRVRSSRIKTVRWWNIITGLSVNTFWNSPKTLRVSVSASERPLRIYCTAGRRPPTLYLYTRIRHVYRNREDYSHGNFLGSEYAASRLNIRYNCNKSNYDKAYKIENNRNKRHANIPVLRTSADQYEFQI